MTKLKHNTVVQSITNRSRVDKFLLIFDVPPILKEWQKKLIRSNEVVNPDTVQFSIFGTIVPEIVVPAVEVRNVGSTLYVSSHNKNSYPPVTIDFKIDNEYRNYWTVYNWLNLLHGEYLGIYNENKLGPIDKNFEDYQTDLTIYAKDEFNKNRVKFIYKKAFPTSIKEIDYNYQEENEITSGFTFVYSQLYIDMV